MKTDCNNIQQSSITILLISLLFLSFNASSQDFEIKGQVLDNSGKPIPGVNVLLKATSNGTATDRDGHFTISIPDKESALVFHFIGFKSTEQRINPEKGYSYEVKVTLVEDKLKYRKDKSSVELIKHRKIE